MSNIDKINNDPVWLRIKSLRSGVRGEQTELMAYCGLAQNTYNGWDKGTLKSYTKYIDKIASFYKVSADWILTGAEKAPSETGERSDDPDLYRIERARKNMSSADKQKMMRILEASFEDFFSDDYKDFDLNE